MQKSKSRFFSHIKGCKSIYVAHVRKGIDSNRTFIWEWNANIPAIRKIYSDGFVGPWEDEGTIIYNRWLRRIEHDKTAKLLIELPGVPDHFEKEDKPKYFLDQTVTGQTTEYSNAKPFKGKVVQIYKEDSEYKYRVNPMNGMHHMIFWESEIIDWA